MEKEQIYKILKKGGIWTIAIIVGLIIIAIANFLFFWSILGWLTNAISTGTGIDYGLAKAIAGIMMILIVMLPLGKIVRSFSPVPQKNKGAYRAVIFVIIAIFSTIIYFGGKDANFDSQTRRAMKFYCEWPNGEIHVYEKPGFDPTTGDSLKIMTKEMALKLKGISTQTSAPASYSGSTVQPSTYTPPTNYRSDVYSPAVNKTEQSAIVKNEAIEQVETISNEDVKYYPPIKQVNPITGESMDKNGSNSNSGENYSRSTTKSRCLTHVENKSNFAAKVTNLDGYELFKIEAGFSVQRELEPGSYYLINNYQKIRFSLIEGQPFFIELKESGYTSSKNTPQNHGNRPVRQNFRPGYHSGYRN